MKNYFITISIVLMFSAAQTMASETADYYPTYVSLGVNAENIDAAAEHILHFAQLNAMKVLDTKLRVDHNYITLTANVQTMDSLYKIVQAQGSISVNDRTFNDPEATIDRLQADVEVMEADTAKLRSSSYRREELIKKRRRIDALRKNADLVYVEIDITGKSKDAPNDWDDDGGRGFLGRFVNMPGFEYGILVTENPAEGFSSAYYNTYMLKYLITRGKSYFVVGAMIASEPARESPSLYQEYFVFNFGQDFYPRRWRRSRRYFNPYTGYQAGVLLATNKNRDNSFIWNINVAIGLELVKTRSFLIDSKVQYFLPLHERNRDMRGLQAGIAVAYLL